MILHGNVHKVIKAQLSWFCQACKPLSRAHVEFGILLRKTDCNACLKKTLEYKLLTSSKPIPNESFCFVSKATETVSTYTNGNLELAWWDTAGRRWAPLLTLWHPRIPSWPAAHMCWGCLFTHACTPEAHGPCWAGQHLCLLLSLFLSFTPSRWPGSALRQGAQASSAGQAWLLR